jgi:hypothetical protein
MEWVKRGFIYVASGKYEWAKTHAMIPTPDIRNDNEIRVYLTFCDGNGVGRVGYVDLDSNDPCKILAVSKMPVLDIGNPGTFDENGTLQCSIVTLPDGRKYLYYAGFEIGKRIRYRLLSGVAVSINGGDNFQRIQKTPILERSNNELYFRGGPFALIDNNIFKLWYVAGSSWTEIDGKMMPVYTINYLESPDGIYWGGKGKVCIDFEYEDEYAFGRPYVLIEDGFYRMFYSIRKRYKGYRLGYAESKDGITWKRKDDQVGLDISMEGWDSESICYSAVIILKEKVYMFYNGNEFGKTGFGYAELKSW